MTKKYALNINFAPTDKILILDGKYLAYRTKHAKHTYNLSYKGIRTGLYYGFFNTLRHIGQMYFPVNTVIMWDADSRTGRRKEQFEGYKNRGKNWNAMSQDEKDVEITFAQETENLMALCDELGFASYLIPRYEADDLIALWVKKYPDLNNVIITRDEDMYQCLINNTIIYDPDSKINKDVAWFKKKYGIEPSEWTKIKAIGGCTSDTIPGLPGIAEKTALKYLKGEATEKVIEKIEVTHTHLLNKYYDLVELPHKDLKDFFLPYKQTALNKDLFFDMCQELGFYSFIEALDEFEVFH